MVSDATAAITSATARHDTVSVHIWRNGRDLTAVSGTRITHDSYTVMRLPVSDLDW
ncbi:hypothetical protein GCM10017788_51580 [Amycolatopsis acidiphila]|nr:hypothetical protein GCM10017788_51580 [Amycolatopsis acidiphila]